jgi:hypothetical protein
MLGRILRRNDDERQRQRPGDALDGDLFLGHRLEQGRTVSSAWRG